MAPIYALDSWLGLRYESLTLYFDVLRECYEAFVIYSFYVLLLTYLGGELTLMRILATKPAQKHAFPFCCLKPWTTGDGETNEGTFLLQTQIGTLQYVVVKTICAVLTLLLSLFGAYGDGSLEFNKGYPYIALITNCSQIWAMYCLILFYLALKEELAPMRPVPKFLVVKAVVFFTFWQSVLLVLLFKTKVINYKPAPDEHYTESEVIARIQDFIVCVEMTLAAISHHYAFPYREFHDPNHRYVAPLFRSLFDAMNVTDVYVDDVRNAHRRVKAARTNRSPEPSSAPPRLDGTAEFEDNVASTPSRSSDIPLVDASLIAQSKRPLLQDDFLLHMGHGPAQHQGPHYSYATQLRSDTQADEEQDARPPGSDDII